MEASTAAKSDEEHNWTGSPGGVNLAEKVTNFDMLSNDLHI